MTEPSFAADQDRSSSALALVIAAVSLGQALQVANGNLDPKAVLWLTIAFAFCAVGAVVRSRLLSVSPTVWVLGVGLAAQFAELLTDPPAMYLQLRGPRAAVPFIAGLAVAGFLAGAGLSESPWLGRLRMPLLLLVHFLLGVWLIRSSPNPYIDVYVFQRDGLSALLRGTNPYAMTFPDIYGNSPFYGPGLSVNGRLTFGFPYPPLSLLLAAPGHLLAGDYRYSQLAAMTLSGALMTYARPGSVGAIAATVFLFTPRVFFVLEQGWTEPFVVLLLAASVFAACRAPKLLPVMLGLLFAIKQYTVLAVPAVVLLLPRPFDWKQFLGLIGKAAVVALAVSVPLILWNVPSFIRDVVTLQLHQPFRPDALSYLAWLGKGSGSPPNWIAIGAALFAAGVALWRAPRTPSGFATAVALTSLAFFAFNKQAFCNYYFFVVGACCVGIAARNAAAYQRM